MRSSAIVLPFKGGSMKLLNVKKKMVYSWSVEGLKIYEELKKKYPNSDSEHLDAILNSICFSLSYLFFKNSSKEKSEECADIVRENVMDNLRALYDNMQAL